MLSNSLFHPASTPTITDKQFKRATTNFQDSVACLSWAPNENPNLLACSSWDGRLTVNYVTSRNAEVSAVEDVYRVGPKV